MPIIDHFTYGFELEGLFSQDLFAGKTEAEKEFLKSGHFHQDGSVSIYDEFDEMIGDDNDPDYHAHEYSSPVINSFDDLMYYLSMFNGDTYHMNDTCGFHLHIKPKDEEGERIKSIMASYAFLKQFKQAIFSRKNLVVNDQIPFFDSYQVERLRGESKRWCQPYDGEMDDMYQTWRRRDKYRCIRNHPQGTLEFRLFSPYPGKEDRVQSLFTIIEKIVKKCENVGASQEIEKKKEKTTPFLLHIGKQKNYNLDDDVYYQRIRRNTNFSYNSMINRWLGLADRFYENELGFSVLRTGEVTIEGRRVPARRIKYTNSDHSIVQYNLGDQWVNYSIEFDTYAENEAQADARQAMRQRIDEEYTRALERFRYDRRLASFTSRPSGFSSMIVDEVSEAVTPY